MNQAVELAPIVGQHRPVTYAPQQIDLIHRTVAADCNPQEFDLFMEVCRRTALDPFRRQICAVVYNKDDPKKRKMSIIVQIDGYRVLSFRSGRYRPDENPPVVECSEAAKNSKSNPLGIVKATAKINVFGPDHKWYPVACDAYWDEYAPIKEIWRNQSPTGEFEIKRPSNWIKMGRVMISKCAEAQCHRKANPEELSGTYIQEEMDQAAALDTDTASVVLEQLESEKRLRITNTKDTIFVIWASDRPMDVVPVGEFYDRACAFIRECNTVADVTGWRDTNAVGLRSYWGHQPNDAIALKAEIEKRIEALSNRQPDHMAA